jgi:aldose 1-epimerase
MLLGTVTAEASRNGRRMSDIQKSSFGTVDGIPVELYALQNDRGTLVKIITYGASLIEVHVRDRCGRLDDVVLGVDTLAGYRTGPYFGAVVGRVANRISDASFTLDGKKYELAANDGAHHLHGGMRGWSRVVWAAKATNTPQGPRLALTHVSPDGDEGYPGTVTAATLYTLTNDDKLLVTMNAVSDQRTIVNMAHHSYWNLGGRDCPTVLDHQLTIYAARYTPGTPVPDGEERPVAGTAFDFRVGKPLRRDLEAAGGRPVGFDHNWILDGDPYTLRSVARLRDPSSGRVLTLQADQPGLQLYAGTQLDGTTIGKGVRHVQYAGVCLESQRHPNSINVPRWRRDVVLPPRTTYTHRMVHSFTVEP